MKLSLVYLLIGLTILNMCLPNRGKRGGRNRRINVIVSNTDYHKRKSNNINYSNLIEVSLLSNSVNDIEVLASDRTTRPSADLDRNNVNKESADFDRNNVNKESADFDRKNLVHIKTNDEHRFTKICVLNLQSACNKVDAISDFILENDCDIAFLTETWVSEDNNFVCQQFTPNGFSTYHISRVGKLGGGVGIVIRNSIKTIPMELDKFKSFEYVAVRLNYKSEYVTLVDIYRPPGYVSNDFLNEFSQLLEHFTLQKDRVLLCGDFNIHFENKNNTAVTKFNKLISAFGLKQHVEEPTHTSGHTIDLVLTRSDDTLISPPEANQLFSDHFAVCFRYGLHKPRIVPSTIRYRKLRQLNLTQFKEDLSHLKNVDTSENCLDTLMCDYNTILRNALDKHAPIITKRVKGPTAKPWYDDDIHKEKNTRRKLERAWRKQRTDENLNRYKAQKNRLNQLIDNKKVTFCNTSISDKTGDPKALYALVRRLTNKPTVITYPESTNNEALAEQFSTFFEDKIKKINNSLDSATSVELPPIQPRSNHSVYSDFPTMSVDKVKKYIAKSPSKSCTLDPIPTHLLKQCMDDVAPTITEIVNKSLSTGYMP